MTVLQELRLEIEGLMKEKEQLEWKNSFLNPTFESSDIKRQRKVAIDEINRKLYLLNRRYNLESTAFNENQAKIQHQQDLESIRNSVPKIPIYKNVPLHCPKCMGRRNIDTNIGKVICPYCDYVELLPIDHYIVNEKEIQRQIQQKEKENQLRINQEQERQLQKKKTEMQNNSRNSLVVAIFFIVVFLGIIIRISMASVSVFL